MDWQIDIPFNDRSDLVLDTITAAKEKFGEDDQRTQLVEVLAKDALLNRSITSVGGLLDDLGGLDQAGVRARLDWARGELGLPSTGEVEQRREDYRFEAAFQRLQPPAPPRWSEWQTCHGPNCDAFKETGVPAKVTVEKWYCPNHKHLAQPGDLDEHEAPYIGLTHTGKPVPSAKEKARIEAWHRERQEAEERERRQREEYERREYEAVRKARERYEETATVSVLGHKVHPKNVRFHP